LDEGQGFVGYFSELAEVVGGAEDEIVDSVEAAVGAKVEA